LTGHEPLRDEPEKLMFFPEQGCITDEQAMFSPDQATLYPKQATLISEQALKKGEQAGVWHATGSFRLKQAVFFREQAMLKIEKHMLTDEQACAKHEKSWLPDDKRAPENEPGPPRFNPQYPQIAPGGAANDPPWNQAEKSRHGSTRRAPLHEIQQRYPFRREPRSLPDVTEALVKKDGRLIALSGRDFEMADCSEGLLQAAKERGRDSPSLSIRVHHEPRDRDGVCGGAK
jgi:hypothetical protein